MKKITFLISIFSFMMGMSQNLIINGDFQNGTTGWSGNAANVVCQASNCYNSAVVNTAGNPWDVNLSYVLNIPTVGVNYQLIFTAWSNVNRPLIAGIGLNQDPWTNTTQTVNLTSAQQTFTLNLTSNFSSATSRIIFDMGNAIGEVNIDNVILQLAPSTPSQLPLLLDFETASQFTFSGFEGLASATVVADPVSGGTNGNGFRLQNQTSGNPWQGAEVVLSGNKRVRLTTNKTMQVDVYSTQAFNLLLKVEVGAAASATAASYTTPGQWQTLTFNFTVPMDGTGVANGDYQKIVFFGGWNATNNGFVAPSNFAYHVDNIRGEEGNVGPPPAPTVAAPTPPARPAADVKSIFSDAYAPISTIGYTGNDNTFDNSWCGATTTLVQIAGNNTHMVTGLGCEGVTFIDGRFDATTFTHFHIDMWTPTATLDKSFNVKFSNWNGGAGEANAIEFSINNGNLLTNPNTGNWYSFDIPLSAFTPITNANRNDIVQFVITSDLGTVYYDNLYLHKNTVLSVNEFDVNNKVTIYPNPANSIINLNAKHNIEQVAIFNITGQQILVTQPNIAETSIDVSNFNSGIYLVKTLVNGVENTTKFVKN
ncbi:MAG: carbohydrate binding domain-containing protein [Flavobacteriales bacterium]|nr:carbohydrate binding domain-containing protein [Flavobacteriales bacterium]